MIAPRDHTSYFNDILKAIEHIEKYTTGFTVEDFKKSDEKQDAVVRNLEIIGEAVKRIPDAVRATHPNIQWRPAAAMRDYLIHDYPEVDPEVVWNTIINDLPPLKKGIELAMPMNR